MMEFVKVVFAGLIGGAVTLAGQALGYWNKDRELDIRMVDVALTILSAKDDGTKTRQARLYALNLLDTYGRVDISEKDKAEWADSGQVPIGDWKATALSNRAFSSAYIVPGFQPERKSINEKPGGGDGGRINDLEVLPQQ